MYLSNIAPNISLDLKADAVEYLIRETFKNHTPGYEVDKVIFSSSTEYDLRGDSCGKKFNGAKVTFKKVGVATAGFAACTPSSPWEGTYGIPYSPETINKLEK